MSFLSSVRRASLAGAFFLGLGATSAHAATFSVVNLNDSGDGSLRQAITNANADSDADTITFDSALTGTLALTSGELPISNNVTITGPGADVLAVSGGNTSRLFNISGGTVAMSGLTLTRGSVVGTNGAATSRDGGEARGGAILNAGALSLAGMVLSQNSAVGGQGARASAGRGVHPAGRGGDARGGAIYNAGTLSLSETSLENNSATGGRGGEGHTSSYPEDPYLPGGAGGNALGGAIYNANIIRLGNATFANNSIAGGTGENGAQSNGSGLSPDVRDVSPSVQDVIISGRQNKALTAQLQGTGDSALTYSLVSGTLPLGLSLNGTTGVISGTPTELVQGRQVTYKASDGLRDSNTAPLKFNIVDTESPSLVVTTDQDVVNNKDDLTSLREAVTYANTLLDPSTISFQLSGAGPYSIALGNTALSVSQTVTVQGVSSGSLTLVAGSQGIFSVATGAGLALRNLTLSGSSNSAVAGLVNNGALDITTCSLVGRGGSLDNYGGTLSISGSTLSGDGNSIVNGDLSGRAPGTANMSECVVHGITGSSSFIKNYGGTLRLSSCTLSGNTIEVMPLIFNRATLKLSNCTLYGNMAHLSGRAAAYGGGVIQGINSELDSSTLESCTITGNSVTPSGASAVFGATVRNSLIVGNTGGDLKGPLPTTNSLIGGTAKAAGLQTDSAGNPVLKNNGGATETVALVASSVAVGAGQTDLKTDQRGLTRPVGTGADIGAFELQSVSPPPVITVNSPSVSEGNSGTTFLPFVVTLNKASANTVTVVVNTSQGTAKSGSDYQSVGRGTVTFAPGTTSQTFNVQVVGDTVIEGDEQLRLDLRSPINATIGATSGTGTILNDDLPSISINSPSVQEGNSGTTAFTFTLTLSQASQKEVSVIVNTSQGTAKAGSDYVSVGRGTVMFAPGITKQTFTVQVIGDTHVEGNEQLRLDLRSPVGATLATTSGTGTILNDDSPPKSPALAASGGHS